MTPGADTLNQPDGGTAADRRCLDHSSQELENSLPPATVVVPTVYKSPEGLTRTIESLLALDYPHFDIVVVDNRVRGRTATLMVPTHPRLRTAIERTPGISAARNRGVSCSSAEFVAFTDDDVVVDRRWLQVLGTTFARDAEIEAIGGSVFAAEARTEPQKWFEQFFGGFARSEQSERFGPDIDRLDDPLFPYAAACFGAGCNMAFRRATLERMGGFITTLGTGTPARGGEDLAMFIELVSSGGTAVFEPTAVVRHFHRRSERAFFEQVFSYGVGLTAMLTAIAWRDSGHVMPMVRRIPGGLLLLLRPRHERARGQTPTYPRRTIVYQVMGMMFGPFAYVLSAWRARRRSST